MKDTGYLPYFAGLVGGEQRITNIKMLLEKAENYEKTSYFGLFHFIRYMEQLQKYDIEVSENGSVEESRDAVRIMSIHKSKGLEFPICIVAGLSKKMNQQDVNASLVCDMDLGIGMEYRNPKLRVKNTDMRRNVLAEKMRLDNLGEELRILYVAMTRAKEKLILSGVVKNYEECMAGFEEVKRRKEEKLPYGILSRSTSFMDFLLPATVRDNGCIKTILWNPWEAGKRQEAESLYQQVSRLEVEERLKAPLSSVQEEVKEELQKKFHFVYGYQNLQGLYAKTSVSELKMKAMEESDAAAFQMFEEPELVPYVPTFVEEKTQILGTVRGNAYHRVMELLDFASCRNTEQLFFKMEQLVKDKVLEENYLKLIRKDKMEKFLQSSLAGRMAKAAERGKLFREQPFVLGIGAKRLDEKFPEGEKVLIQGIIDAFFEEEGEIVLVDYKTDAIKKGEDLVKRYRTQMEYYQEALEKLTGKRVKEKILYSFALNQCVEVF